MMTRNSLRRQSEARCTKALSASLSLVAIVCLSMAATGAELVSIDFTGTASANNASDEAVISADGRFVAFSTFASDLGPSDTNGLFDVYVRDLVTGTTTLVSTNSSGTNGGNGSSGNPSISADGRFVAFVSRAGDLGPTDVNGRLDIYVRDLVAGTTTLASVNASGTSGGNSFSLAPRINADGRFVGFTSIASDLGPTDTNGTWDVYVRDLVAGTTILASINGGGTDSGNADSSSGVGLAISTDGRFVAFVSTADDLGPTDTNGLQDIYVRDLVAGTTMLVSVNASGSDSGRAPSGNVPSLSADGRWVAFHSRSDDLVVLNDTNGLDRDVFVRDLIAGTTTLVSANAAGTGSANSFSRDPQISADGRFVAFLSFANDLGPADGDLNGDIYVRDLVAGTTTLVSVDAAGTGSGNGFSPVAAINTDGRFVAFRSFAENLGPTDTNGTGDVYLRDLVAGTTTLASANIAGTDSGSGDSAPSNRLSLSADGRAVAFSSDAGDLVAIDSNGLRDVFVAVHLDRIVSSDVTENLVVGEGETLLITDQATVLGNVSVDGGAVIVDGASTVDGNLEASNGGSITITGGATVTGNVEATDGETVAIVASTIDGNVLTQNNASVTIDDSTIHSNVSSVADGVVSITGNWIGGSLDISAPTSCSEVNNFVSGASTGCP